MTWIRQGLALADYPEMLKDEEFSKKFPEDIKNRISTYLSHLPGGTGAYSSSNGGLILRKEVASGIELRDGFPCDPSSIFLTDGASVGVHLLFKCTLRNKLDGYLVPIPQYPLYSATLALYHGTLVPYYLDESTNWGLDAEHLKN